jgi:hypothetical protein
MISSEKLSYFSIVLMRGLGVGLLFYILAWTGYLEGSPNYAMLEYNFIFGITLIIYGIKLYKAKESKGIQISAILVLSLALIIGIILFTFYPNPKSMVNTILLGIILIIRLYYLVKTF